MEQKKGIWSSSLYNPIINKKFQISLNEGNTPLERLKFLEIESGVEYVYAKREDKNPTGSAKDRMIAYYFSLLKSRGIREIVIPSSGNTAISSIYYSKLADIKVHLFIPSNLDKNKNERLHEAIKKNPNVEVIQSIKPLSSAIQFSIKNNIEILRGSNSKYSEQGYKSLGEELYQINANAIFIPVSSGTTLSGLALKNKSQIHAVQTSKINTISRDFDNDFKYEEESLAKAIVARVTQRKKNVDKIIEKTRGWGWCIENKEIKQYHNILESKGINTSFEGALSVAGFFKALEKGYSFKKVILLFTGK